MGRLRRLGGALYVLLLLAVPFVVCYRGVKVKQHGHGKGDNVMKIPSQEILSEDAQGKFLSRLSPLSRGTRTETDELRRWCGVYLRLLLPCLSHMVQL